MARPCLITKLHRLPFSGGRGARHRYNRLRQWIRPWWIRKKFYNLKKGTGLYNIVDLGNLKKGNWPRETYTHQQKLCPHVVGTIPTNHFRRQSWFWILVSIVATKIQKLVSFHVDAFLDLEDGLSHRFNRKACSQYFIARTELSFSASHLAHQSYLIDPASVAVRAFVFWSVSNRSPSFQLTEMEPAIRNADMFIIWYYSHQTSDAPGNANAQPFGLTGEACQLCWYAGMNEPKPIWVLWVQPITWRCSRKQHL